tara:strand:+ start:81 stop:686 length:606 start_codon:yes stop_codon:yes gene_type:complete
MSSRLPGKVLLPLCNSTILGFLIKRLNSKFPGIPVVVLTGGEGAELVSFYAQKYGAEVIVGDEDNVLSRFIEAACTFKPKYFVRLTADNPFIDLELVKLGLEYILDQKVACVSTRYITHTSIGFSYHGVAKGHNFDVFDRSAFLDLFSTKALNCAASREHVITQYLLNQDYTRLSEESLDFPLNEQTIDTFHDYLRIIKTI